MHFKEDIKMEVLLGSALGMPTNGADPLLGHMRWVLVP
jgi:hypothetical protein